MFRKVIIFVLFVQSALLANATFLSTPPELIGVWRGTVGRHQVVACWDAFGGNFYMIDKPLKVELFAQDDAKNGVWFENASQKSDAKILWQLKEPVGGHLVGTQTTVVGQSKRPIRLSYVRVEMKDKQGELDCNADQGAIFDAFNAPRIAAQKIYPGRLQILMGKSYRSIIALKGKVSSIELIGEEASIEKANKLLLQDFKGQIRSHLWCEFQTTQGGYDYSVRPHFWNDEWLSWSSHFEGYCGGAHAFFDNETNTVELKTGKRVNLWDWFKLIKKQGDNPQEICERRKLRCLPVGLTKRILKTQPAFKENSDDCKKEYFQGQAYEDYAIGLNKKGMAFVPELDEAERAMRTCYANYTIAFAALKPYLNRSGLAAVNRILATLPEKSQ